MESPGVGGFSNRIPDVAPSLIAPDSSPPRPTMLDREATSARKEDEMEVHAFIFPTARDDAPRMPWSSLFHRRKEPRLVKWAPAGNRQFVSRPPS